MPVMIWLSIYLCCSRVCFCSWCCDWRVFYLHNGSYPWVKNHWYSSHRAIITPSSGFAWFVLDCLVCPQMSLLGMMYVCFGFLSLCWLIYFLLCYCMGLCTSSTIYNNNIGRAVSRCAGTWLSRVHWLSHTMTEPVLRQVQQQRWQPPKKWRNTSTSVLVSLHLWALCVTSMILELGSPKTRARFERPAFCTVQRISILVQRLKAVLHDSLPATDCTIGLPIWYLFTSQFLNSLGITCTDGLKNSNSY